MTYEQIQEALQKQVDYGELTRLIELDLNTIAGELVTEPTDTIEFEVFFEFDEFNTKIKMQAPGEGFSIQKTLVLVSFINGDYSSQRGPQFFSTIFNLEIMGFEKDLENLRKIFETYAYLNQGQMSDDVGVTSVKFVEFPVFTDVFDLHGLRRIQGFQRLFMSYIYSGQLSNEIKIKIEGSEVLVQNFIIHRNRVPKAKIESNGETVVYHSEQSITFSGSMIYDGSDGSKQLLNMIHNPDSLGEVVSLAITYPNILIENEEEEEEELSYLYMVSLQQGDANIIEGGYLNLAFTLVLSEV